MLEREAAVNLIHDCKIFCESHQFLLISQSSSRVNVVARVHFILFVNITCAQVCPAEEKLRQKILSY